ncbi:MAG: phosphotransferase [Phycisphaerales bacterium]
MPGDERSDSAFPHHPRGDDASRWSEFDRDELAIALSHYEVGPIRSLRAYRKGSRRSAKVFIDAEAGEFLLKRRGGGGGDERPDEDRRVTFSHRLQQRLFHAGFPLPRLIETRGGVTALRIDGRTYELFEFIRGNAYDQGLQTTYQSGQALALYHRMLSDFRPDWSPSGGGYHNAPQIAAHLGVIPERTGREDLDACLARLRGAYQEAAGAVTRMGFDQWPDQIIHSDWHPGNMLYRGPQVVAVIDYDTARRGRRVLDVANGALQFSVTRVGGDPEGWPEELDESRLKRFCRGYDSVESAVISTAELAALPHLMIEALIVEAVIPIARTGRFAGLDGGSFLRMVERKVRWMQSRVRQIPELLA